MHWCINWEHLEILGFALGGFSTAISCVAWLTLGPDFYEWKDRPVLLYLFSWQLPLVCFYLVGLLIRWTFTCGN